MMCTTQLVPVLLYVDWGYILHLHKCRYGFVLLASIADARFIRIQREEEHDPANEPIKINVHQCKHRHPCVALPLDASRPCLESHDTPIT